MSDSMDHSSPESRIRSLPSNVEAERVVLGAIFLDPGAINMALEYLKIEDFYREPHQKIYEALCDLYSESKPLEPMATAERLRVMGELEKVGGIAYLASLTESVVSTSSVEHYSELIRDKARARRLIQAAQEVVALGMGESMDARELMDESEQLLLRSLEDRSSNTTVSIKEGLKVTMEKLNLLREQGGNTGRITGITTGFSQLDKITLGFQDTDLLVLAARPAMGKTAFALNLALNAAMSGKGVLLFSLEMGVDQLIQRLLAIESRVDLSKLRGGFLAANEWPRLANGVQRLAEIPLFIDETPAISPLEVRSRARRLKLEGKLDMVVVDYLQLMSTSKRIDSREQQISDISRSLKGLAKELHIPVIALSQLNRSLESRSDKRPQLSDLRESGAIEQDADIIMFIYRDEVYNENSDQKGTAEIIIGKHRNGPTDTVRLKFFGAHTRFDNLSLEEEPTY